MLDISGLYSGYEVIKAIKNINVHVGKGGLIFLPGANDAGKSTLLKSVIDMVHIERGSIKYQGEGLMRKKSHEIIPTGISIVPEGRRIFADAVMVGNLAIGSYIRAVDKTLSQRILDQVFELFPHLAEKETQMGGTLSGGEQRMLAIGRAMMSDLKLLLLDEPSMGLAPLVVEQAFYIIEKLKRTGIATLLVKQNTRMVIEVSGHSHMLNTGKVTGKLDASDEVSQSTLLEVCLGKSGK